MHAFPKANRPNNRGHSIFQQLKTAKFTKACLVPAVFISCFCIIIFTVYKAVHYHFIRVPSRSIFYFDRKFSLHRHTGIMQLINRETFGWDYFSIFKNKRIIQTIFRHIETGLIIFKNIHKTGVKNGLLKICGSHRDFFLLYRTLLHTKF